MFDVQILFTGRSSYGTGRSSSYGSARSFDSWASGSTGLDTSRTNSSSVSEVYPSLYYHNTFTHCNTVFTSTHSLTATLSSLQHTHSLQHCLHFNTCTHCNIVFTSTHSLIATLSLLQHIHSLQHCLHFNTCTHCNIVFT